MSGHRLQQVVDSVPRSFLDAMAGQGVVEQFETTMADWLGTKYAIGVASGTLALYIALKAVGVRAGDEVILPAYDWFAATAAVLHCGAVPVFADVDARTYTITPRSVAQLISSRAKAIVATHLFGHPADLLPLRALAEKHKLNLIEDCAQALGAVYRGKKAGAWGDVACFSFGAQKVLSCGEGGLIATNNTRFYEQALALCQHPDRQMWSGLPPNPFCLKAPINPLAAAHLLDQWDKFKQEIAERQAAFERLNNVLAEIGVLEPVYIGEGCVHACYRFCPSAPSERTREDVVESLASAGIAVSEAFLPQSVPTILQQAIQSEQFRWHPLWKSLVQFRKPRRTIAERLCRTLLTIDWQIGKTEEDVIALRDALKRWSENSMIAQAG